MAKTRAQRKAERRAREAQQQRQQLADGSEASDAVAAQQATQVPVSADVAEVELAEAGLPPPPAPSRGERRAEQKRRREDERRREREQIAKRQRQAATEERSRGRVIGFVASCWAELKRVQWPDRETLVQASAVTVVFVAIAAAYLGALDAVFNVLIKHIV